MKYFKITTYKTFLFKIGALRIHDKKRISKLSIKRSINSSNLFYYRLKPKKKRSNELKTAYKGSMSPIMTYMYIQL